MKKYYSNLFCFFALLITGLLFSAQLSATPPTSVACSIIKPNGTATVAIGYTTELTSVTLNNNNTYTIVLTIRNTGVSGSNNKTLSDLCIQPGNNPIISASYQVILGNLKGTLNLDNANPVFNSGFKIEGCSKFGDGYKGAFTITYTIPTLQVQQVAAKAGNDYNITSFSIAELQQVFDCGFPQPPVFIPAPGTYNVSQSLTMATPSDGATIYYTTDGSTPTSSSLKYSGAIKISTSTTLKAIAYNASLASSVVSSGNYVIVQGEKDTDGDGVNDLEDNYPNDPARAYDNIYPATGMGSLVFEDNWPYKADYDMNDMVIDYQFNKVTNASNDVVEIKAKFVLRAMGATFHNGFGIELPVVPSQVAGCSVKLENGQPIPMGSLVSIDPLTGLEMNQSEAVVVLFDDGFKVMPQRNGGTGVNTTPGIPWTNPVTLNMTITFKQNVSADLLKNPIYNPFIFTNQTRGNEIHLPDFPPTSLANKSLFNTGEDKSDPSVKSYYKTANNLPWALNIYEGYDYPIEKASILDAFKHFAEWAESGGTLYPDWYKNLDGYRNTGNVYIRP